MRHVFYALCLVLTLVMPRADVAWAASPSPAGGISILVYHRFGPVVADGMTVRTAVFEQQLA